MMMTMTMTVTLILLIICLCENSVVIDRFGPDNDDDDDNGDNPVDDMPVRGQLGD